MIHSTGCTLTLLSLDQPNTRIDSVAKFEGIMIRLYLVTTYSVSGLRLFSPIAVASSTKRAKPKSVIRNLQSFETRIFPGFKSRSICEVVMIIQLFYQFSAIHFVRHKMITNLRKTPISCMAFIPSSICLAKHLWCISERDCLL